jgi:hypothetical protein
MSKEITIKDKIIVICAISAIVWIIIANFLFLSPNIAEVEKIDNNLFSLFSGEYDEILIYSDDPNFLYSFEALNKKFKYAVWFSKSINKASYEKKYPEDKQISFKKDGKSGYVIITNSFPDPKFFKWEWKQK